MVKFSVYIQKAEVRQLQERRRRHGVKTGGGSIQGLEGGRGTHAVSYTHLKLIRVVSERSSCFKLIPITHRTSHVCPDSSVGRAEDLSLIHI